MFSDFPWLSLVLECLVGGVIGLVLFAVLDRLSRRLPETLVIIRKLVAHSRQPVMVLLPLSFVQVTTSSAERTLALAGPLRHLLSICLILTLTFLCIRLVKAVAEGVNAMYSLDGPDNFKARGILTQTRVFRRIVSTLIVIIGASALLMTFPGVRQIGTSLLASAGMAGLIAGLAARPVLGNLIAGMQIAITQPIRIDDVLIVKGEWGRVEEITGSYVVFKIWDERRLIVPLEWFIQNPFENWTRSSTQIMGTVFFWVDYGMPMEPLRQELERVCREAPEWDGRICGLQVTDTTERTVQVRALVSAQDASLAWDLRCRVREALIDFMQKNYPESLPRLRGSMHATAIEEAHDVFS